MSEDPEGLRLGWAWEHMNQDLRTSRCCQVTDGEEHFRQKKQHVQGFQWWETVWSWETEDSLLLPEQQRRGN